MAHAHATTTADGSTDAHPASTHAQSQLLPFHPANPPTHFTAGNAFGPYVFNHITTNRPHPQFLDSLSNPILVKLDVANYLHSNHNYTHNLPHNNTTVDTFRYYLYASLARHHSYKKAYLRSALTKPMRSYRQKYQTFTIHFTTALQSILNNKETPTPKQQNDVLTLERTLTHETFALWPHLFDRSFDTNSTLLLTTSLQAPSLLNVLAFQPDPLAFLTSLKSNLDRGREEGY